MTYLSTPNKRKSEKRDDEVIVTPSSTFDDSECDDSPRDTDSFVSTPCQSFESPVKRRKTSLTIRGPSQLSPPLMRRIEYRPTSISSHANSERSSSFLRGRPVLDIFDSSGSSISEQPENDLSELSFLAIPTPPSLISKANESQIPSFDLSPRTTLAPQFPELHDSRLLFPRFHAEIENKNSNTSSRRRLPPLRMRPTNTRNHRTGTRQMMEELSLPTLSEITLREPQRERRSSLPAVAA